MAEDSKLSPPVLENESRRKAVKTIVGGVTVLAAYNVMPVKWGTPIIEQVFLPAHAATSGSSLHDPCTVTHEGSEPDTFLITGFVTPPTEGLPTTIVLTPSLSGTNLTAITATTTTLADGTFSATIEVTGESDRVDVTTTVEGADGSASCFSVKPDGPTCGEEGYMVPVAYISGNDMAVFGLNGAQNAWSGVFHIIVTNNDSPGKFATVYITNCHGTVSEPNDVPLPFGVGTIIVNSAAHADASSVRWTYSER